MTHHACYDISRLLTRFFRSTPNGIDRVDYTIAEHILTSNEFDASAAVVTAGRPFIVGRQAAADALAALGRRWRETECTLESDPEYARVVDFLRGNKLQPHMTRARMRSGRVLQGLGAWIAKNGVPLSFSAIPPGSLYINVSQFPLWAERPFRWLGARKDTRAVFFIHDLLPLTFPEYFPRGELERHRTRLANFAKFGSAAVVSAPAVERELRAHLESLGRSDCPIHVGPLPVASAFHDTGVSCVANGQRPFFLLCSTLEPRKNHLMVLTVWRMLVERFGRQAPILILAGKRGWKYQPIIDLIRNCPGLCQNVIETNHLSTPAIRQLMGSARAVLMPTFGEGFGLPVYEALTAGVPVIAADIPAFRDIEAEGLTLLSPIDGEAWLEEIASKTEKERGTSKLKRPLVSTDRYFTDLTQFLRAI